MRADLVLDTARIYGVHRFDVVRGQAFDVQLSGVETPVDWFADADAVLKIDTGSKGWRAHIVAMEAGTSRIELQQHGRVVLAIVITVYDPKRVARLKGKVGAIEQK